MIVNLNGVAASVDRPPTMVMVHLESQQLGAGIEFSGDRFIVNGIQKVEKLQEIVLISIWRRLEDTICKSAVMKSNEPVHGRNINISECAAQIKKWVAILQIAPIFGVILRSP